MDRSVYITKDTLFNLLGQSAISMAMFMASGTQEGTAFRILLDNIAKLDLNSPMVKEIVIPMLVQVNVLNQQNLDDINAYVADALI